MNGFFKKKTVDSALLHIGNAIGKLELMIQAADATKTELESLARCFTNADERIQGAKKEHDSHRGDWTGKDMSIADEFNSMLDMMSKLRVQLQALSDIKARKKA